LRIGHWGQSKGERQVMAKKIMKLGGNAGECVIDQRDRYTVLTFDQKEAADKFAQSKGVQVQTKIVGAAKIRSFVVIVKS